jgi:hemolysin activation/secretion protein
VLVERLRLSLTAVDYITFLICLSGVFDLFRFPTSLVLLMAGLATSQGATAQAAPEPGAIERTIPTQMRQSVAGPAVAVPTRKGDSRSGGRKKFTLGAVNIDGATIFSQAELSRYFEAYLATEVDQDRLAQIAQEITARYRKSGYLLSYASLPQQNVEAGMVRLSVVEGRIDKISVQGAGSAQGAIEAMAAPLLKGGPVTMGALERTIGLIRDFPGYSVTDISVMRSGTADGPHTLKVTLVPDRFRTFTYADNRGVGSLGHSRIFNSFAISSLAVQGDELRVDLFAMPGGRTRYLYGQVSAATPLGRQGLRLMVSGSRGDQYLRADEGFKGQADNISAQLSYPFLRARKLTLIGKTSLTDWRSVGSQAGARRLRDRLRVGRLGVEFSTEGKTRLQGEFALSRGFGFGGMTERGDPLASRQDASGRFTKAALSMQATRPLDDRLTFRAVAMAQYSDRPLLSAEEFSLGGNRLGRAFDFNAGTGDRGAGAGAELGYRLGKDNARLGVELFGFVDAGVARDLKSDLAPGVMRRLASTGLGSRFTVAGTTLAVEAGVPLKGQGKPRLFVSAFRAF